ncbi:MAG: ABC transporter ATP-binding protein [Actinomycetota bacterium]|nr:ABC transporter ATP-binding protein [Actinomycetota bacterium]
MARVFLEDVWKLFGRVEAVKNLTLESKNKEFLSILGPSGCGKTTALRMIAGLEKPTKGDVYINERVVNRLEPQERNIAMVFETYGLYPHFTVYGNIAYPLKIRGLPSTEIRKRVSEIAKILEIEDILGRMPFQTAGGQKQRVGLARALVRQPAVTLMDEPISHLDTKLRHEMRGEIKRLQEKLGNTTIYVTHDQLEAVAIADRIAVMDQGEIQQVGTPEEIYFHPVNEFVADFVGSPPINFFDCLLKRKENILFVCYNNLFEIPLSGEQCTQLSKVSLPQNQIRLGVRAQNIDISAYSTDTHPIKGLVYIIEPLGEKSLLTVKIGEKRVKIETSSELSFELDQAVWLNFDKSKLHFFNPQSRQRIL